MPFSVGAGEDGNNGRMCLLSPVAVECRAVVAGGVRVAGGGDVQGSYSHRVSCWCHAVLCNASVLKGMKSGGSFISVV